VIPIAVRCPHCNMDLMDDQFPLDGLPSIRLILIRGGQEHDLRLSSIYGSFRYHTEAEVEFGEPTVVTCPGCKKTILTDSVCHVCQAWMGKLLLNVGGSVFFCSRRGCKYHRIELLDPERSLVELTRR